MTDVVEGDGLALDRVKDAIDASATAVQHLPEREPEKLRLFFGDGMLLWVLSELPYRPVKAGIPPSGRSGGTLRKPPDGFQGINMVCHLTFFFSARMCRISANTSSAGTPRPARIC